MKISDKSISTTALQEYPLADRFLKLPVQKFLGLQGITPIDPQIAMINSINDPRYRFVVPCLSRRIGKTYGANLVAFLKLMEPSSTVLIISPNYALSEISWAEQLNWLNANNIPRTTENKKDKIIMLDNQSLLKLGSVGQAASCLGRSYDLILFDEAAIDDRGGDVFNVILRPTLDRPNSKAIFISTPRADNWYKTFYDRGTNDEHPLWVSLHATYLDNPRLSPSDIKEARNTLSKAFFSQEYEASFAVLEGSIYGEDFDPETQVRDLSEMDWSGCDTILSVDPGFKDSTGAMVIKFDPETRLYYVVEDYQVADKTTDVHGRAFAHMIEEWEVDFCFIDSANAQFRADLAELYDVPSNKALKDVLPGISYCQALIQQERLIVDISCEHTLAMLRNYKWDDREGLIKPKAYHCEHSHLADSMRYGLYSCRLG